MHDCKIDPTVRVEKIISDADTYLTTISILAQSGMYTGVVRNVGLLMETLAKLFPPTTREAKNVQSVARIAMNTTFEEPSVESGRS